ncbi:MAG: putative NAD(P)H nitroreductase YdjA [Microgenomates bacterium OLB22]|nr:MAG: putative NAD(P)H nitroreductase YdjA [Microgenomates bacterium OLB22]
MNVLDAINTRRSVRKWQKRAVAKTTLNKILNAGRMAPSPLNSQPWHFSVIVDRKMIKTLAASAQHGAFAQSATVLIVVTIEQSAKVDTWLHEHDQHIYSGVCAIQNMWLAAWSLGIGGCWITIDRKATEKLLGVPRSHVLLGSLALGHPTGKVHKHLDDDRRPLSDMVTFDSFR